jgi:hypothetical protein
MLLLTLAVVSGVGRAQETSARSVMVTVSYITSQTVYLDGGKNRSLAPGDTGMIFRGRVPSALLVIAAVSHSSSSARFVTPGDSASVGDSVFFARIPSGPRAGGVPRDSVGRPARTLPRAGSSPSLIHGRIGLQYTGGGEIGGAATLARPSLLFHLSAGPFAGSRLTFSVHGRVDGSFGSTPGSWSKEGTTLCLYDLTIGMDDPSQWYGFSAGRISSAFVGGLGLVDGAQVLVRTGRLTTGVLGGFQPDYRTSGFDSQTQKLAGFLNVAWGERASLRNSTTIAYGQQLFHGILDRDFLYLQNSAAFSTTLFLYQNTEIDLHRLDAGGRKADFRLTNTFLTLNYQPLDWLTANLGYDASRRIEFLETEKTLRDSLLDRDLRQGFRGSLYFRLPLNIALSLLGGYRLPAGGLTAGYSAGSGLRLSDIGGSGISLGGQYMRLRSPYTEGNDITGDLEYSPTGSLLLSLRWNQYAFTPLGVGDQDGRVTIATLTGSASWNVTRGWYVTLFGDRVRESDRLMYRVFVETGYHF